MASNREAVILDTDIGTDVDDVIALALALRSPAIDLLAITTVYVNAMLRARMVRTVLEVAGRPEIPIGVGADQPLLRRDLPYWAGWEGEGLLRPGDFSGPLPHAVDLLIETVMARQGQVTVLAIGPLTNIATALLRAPGLVTAIRRLVIMGGMVQRRFDQLHLSYSEHNVRSDPEAAQIVLSAGVPITLVPLDVTTQVQVRRGDLPRLEAGDPLARLVADQIRRYLGYRERDSTHLHDPLACAGIIRPAFLQTYPMRVDVETDGALTRGQTVAVRYSQQLEGGAPPIDVALSVEARAFERWLIDTLAGVAAAGSSPAGG